MERVRRLLVAVCWAYLLTGLLALADGNVPLRGLLVWPAWVWEALW